MFALPPAKLGLAYPVTGLRDVLGAVSAATAKDLLFTGRRIAADEALRLGLVTRVVGLPRLPRRRTQSVPRSPRMRALSILAAKRALAAISATAIPQDQWMSLSV